MRLDRSIADLLEVLDKKVGLQNVLIFVTSTGYIDSESPDSGLYKVPGGEFYLNRCAALLNMYLMATYGEGKYVEAHHNQQIYLNHKLLEKKELNLAEIQQKSAEFLMQFSGVNEAYSANRLLLGSWTPEIYKIRNGYHRKRSGCPPRMDYRQRKRRRQQGGTSFLYSLTADFHGTFRETGHYPDTCNH